MSSKFNPIHGKKVVIIGGSSGLGFGAAEISLERGAVVFIGSSTASKVDSAIAKLKAAYPSGAVQGQAVDMKDDASVQAFFEWVAAAGNTGIDHLIYSAGDSLALAPLSQTNTSNITDTFDVRVFGIFRAVKAAQPLLNVGSSITLTTGSAAFKPSPGWTAVGAVTGAIVSLTKALAVELAPIRVNALAPGMVKTELWDSIPVEAREGLFKKGAEGHLTGTIGHPDDVSQGYFFCMSSRFVTGQVILIEGGALLMIQMFAFHDRRIFVRGVPFDDFLDSAVQDVFAQFGPIKSWEHPFRRDILFVTFFDPRAATNAQRSGAPFLGQAVEIHFARCDRLGPYRPDYRQAGAGPPPPVTSTTFAPPPPSRPRVSIPFRKEPPVEISISGRARRWSRSPSPVQPVKRARSRADSRSRGSRSGTPERKQRPEKRTSDSKEPEADRRRRSSPARLRTSESSRSKKTPAAVDGEDVGRSKDRKRDKYPENGRDDRERTRSRSKDHKSGAVGHDKSPSRSHHQRRDDHGPDAALIGRNDRNHAPGNTESDSYRPKRARSVSLTRTRMSRSKSPAAKRSRAQLDEREQSPTAEEKSRRHRHKHRHDRAASPSHRSSLPRSTLEPARRPVTPPVLSTRKKSSSKESLTENSQPSASVHDSPFENRVSPVPTYSEPASLPPTEPTESLPLLTFTPGSPLGDPKEPTESHSPTLDSIITSAVVSPNPAARSSLTLTDPHRHFNSRETIYKEHEEGEIDSSGRTEMPGDDTTEQVAFLARELSARLENLPQREVSPEYPSGSPKYQGEDSTPRAEMNVEGAGAAVARGAEDAAARVCPSSEFAREDCRLAVRNLSPACDSTMLATWASQCAPVRASATHRYYSGEGLIEFFTPADRLLALHTLLDSPLLGRPVRLISDF